LSPGSRSAPLQRRRQPQVRLRAARPLGDEHADVGVAQADEHVLVGDVVADRDDRRALRRAAAQPRERRSLVRRPVADLARIDGGQPLERRLGLEPLVDDHLGRRGDRRVTRVDDPPPVQRDRARFALDDRAGVAGRQHAERALDLVELRQRRQRRIPRAVGEPPHAVLRAPRDARQLRGEVLDELALAPGDDAKRDPWSRAERREQRERVGVDDGLARRGANGIRVPSRSTGDHQGSGCAELLPWHAQTIASAGVAPHSRQASLTTASRDRTSDRRADRRRRRRAANRRRSFRALLHRW
jgi:hypothetical protein